LVSDMLAKRGWKIKTLDIDEGEKADFHENALEFDYRSHSINVVIAFEIFEHIPLETFGKLVKKLSAHKIKKIYFSLPFNKRKIFSFSLKLPKLPQMNWSL